MELNKTFYQIMYYVHTVISILLTLLLQLKTWLVHIFNLDFRSILYLISNSHEDKDVNEHKKIETI